AAPAFVRGKIEREAKLRGFDAQVEHVDWGLGRVWLRGLKVTSPGDDFELKLDAVAVGVFSKSVKATGGTLRGSGDPTHIAEKLRGKASRTSDAAPDSGDAGRELSVDGLHVRWARESATLEAVGVRATRAQAELSLGADSANFSSGKRRAAARDVDIATSSKGGHRQLARLSVGSLELVLGSENATSPQTVAKTPTPARGPPLTEPTSTEDGDEASRAARLRGLVALLRPLLREGLADGASLSLGDVTARVERAGEILSFGPSRLSLLREKDTVRVSLTPSRAEAGVTPLALNTAFPLLPGPLHVVIQGGPVSLSSLGVQNGQLGLRDVEHATLAADGALDFSEDFESVELDGKLSVHALSISRPELSTQPVGPWSFDAALKGRAQLDGSQVTVLSSEAHLGEVRAELSGDVQTTPGQRKVQGRLRVPLSGCQSLVEAMPSGLLPLVGGLRMNGSFGIDLQVRYDQTKPQDASVVLAVRNECRVRDVPPELSPHRFERPFLREVKAPDGSPMSIESGPGTPSWVSLDDISRHMESAILICEDAGFHSHAGFDFRALENALKDDLKQGRFARGASTVSMQLAKNLYLGKEKTLGRKLQEALLTMLLEQQLDKRRILELYLNVVELGPGLYGVGDAAQYYFATPARALTLGQSLYLASLLPNPTFNRFGADGKLKGGWLNYLHKLMHIAHKIKRIDDSELQAALEEEIAFRVPGSSVNDASAPGDGPDPPEAPALPELDGAGKR
ncbi:MAG TPA: biosynthetic peptidoglycan transglycosylase, partial [Polyangiaceae bacterium]|nr:biosynthetic peptidoglycan transglycosylase [Polyangiaceae bacterium]